MMHTKPCPFCGIDSISLVRVASRRVPFWFYVECNVCQTCGPTRLFAGRAVDAWNRMRRVDE